ncbi:MAG: PQQ-binding-like beta-propeller repeat protein [Acidobacteriota bacterium]|nr:PQQ-binding-like beta-propeller repeat protein [Acidobacteriota bacterium]
MAQEQATRGLRLWPGWVLVALAWIITHGSGMVAPATMVQFFGMMIGPLVGLVGILVWWLFASRAPKGDRWLGLLVLVVVPVLTFILAHPSTPMAIVVYGFPILCLAFVLWAALTQRWAASPRRWSLVAVVLVAIGSWVLVRAEGIHGDMSWDFAWRWAETPEEELLEAVASEEVLAPPQAEIGEAVWPGFRGAQRNSVVPGVALATDWSASPPEELWSRPVGPGWSSFAVAGDLLYTQEQRGEQEAVSCYRASTGEPVWIHEDPARFWEPMAGTGPRATPTVHRGRVYALGATGILNALNALDGSRLWRRDVAEDTGAKTPEWGFSSSPLVVDGLVVVHTGAPDGKAVVAYDELSGEPRWFAPAGALSYSSVHLATLHGVRQLLIVTGDGVTSLAPADGSVLWRHEWPAGGGARVTQPWVLEDDTVLVGTSFGLGTRRLAPTKDAGSWSVAEVWTTRRLKPYYNDFVVHGGHVYGFDGRILTCIGVEDGERAWKGGRYGNGQMLLLPEQDLLLVISDRGDVALVEAAPGAYTEVARIAAIEGKTWNHPVIADGVLYVRNGEEMAAFRLPMKSGKTSSNKVAEVAAAELPSHTP